MKVITLDIPGPFLIEPSVHRDKRGRFVQTYHKSDYERLGIEPAFVQDNCSVSDARGTIRGMHYQSFPMAQSKLIHAGSGSIWNVFVDLRRESRWFGKWGAVELEAESFRQLFVPRGFANGFCSLSDNTMVCYKVDNLYSPEHEQGFIWNDPAIGIEWPTDNPILSDRDRKATPFDPAAHCFAGAQL